MKTAAKWLEVLISCGVKPATAVRWADLFSTAVLDSAFSKGAQELDDFLANVLHESGMLESLDENLNYKAEALLSGFGRHRISEADCWAYGRTDEKAANQPMIANTLYGGEWGAKYLGNTELGDGWKYRGRGLIQVTGRANYRRVGDLIGQDLEANPDLLAQPSYALESAIAFWEGNIPDSVIGNVLATRKKVNGGDKGLAHVASLTAKLGTELA